MKKIGVLIYHDPALIWEVLTVRKRKSMQTEKETKHRKSAKLLCHHNMELSFCLDITLIKCLESIKSPESHFFEEEKSRRKKLHSDEILKWRSEWVSDNQGYV